MKVSKNKVALLSLAVASLFATTANAVIVLSAPPAVIANSAKIYASEIKTPFVLTNAANALDLATQLGIGMSAAQDRYIKVVLSGASFATAVVAGSLVDTTTAFANQTISVGGGIGSSSVIIQATGNAAGNQIADALTFTMPNLNLTSTAATATVCYEVYEFLTQAQATTPMLYQRCANVAKFAAAVKFSSTASQDSTATAASSFFNVANVGAQIGAITATKPAIASVTLTTPVQATQLPAAGVPLLADGVTLATVPLIVDAAGANTIGMTGDFSAAAAAASITATAGADVASAFTATTATIPVANTTGSLSGVADLVRYLVNGTTALPVSAYAATFTGVPLAGYVLSPLGPVSTGSIVRDGVTFESPWMTTTPGFLSRLFITQITPATIPWTAIVRNASGIVTGGVLSGTLGSNQVTRIDLSTMVPATAVGPFQVSITIAATADVSEGSYVLTTPTSSVVSMPLYRATQR